MKALECFLLLLDKQYSFMKLKKSSFRLEALLQLRLEKERREIIVHASILRKKAALSEEIKTIYSLINRQDDDFCSVRKNGFTAKEACGQLIHRETLLDKQKTLYEEQKKVALELEHACEKLAKLTREKNILKKLKQKRLLADKWKEERTCEKEMEDLWRNKFI